MRVRAIAHVKRGRRSNGMCPRSRLSKVEDRVVGPVDFIVFLFFWAFPAHMALFSSIV